MPMSHSYSRGKSIYEREHVNSSLSGPADRSFIRLSATSPLRCTPRVKGDVPGDRIDRLWYVGQVDLPLLLVTSGTPHRRRKEGAGSARTEHERT